MRNLKKFLALVLVMMMAFSLLVTVNAATTQADYEAAYETLENYGIFKGVTGNAPSLNTNFTRAQMAAVAYRVATGDIKDEQIGLYAAYAAEQFTDVNEGDWYAGYIGFCANQGIVVGLGDGRFGPNSNVTGMQASAMLLRLLGYGRNGEFEGAGWDKNVATRAAQVNITKGLTDSDLISYASRGVAAYLTLNGATIPDMVTYYYGDYYSPNGYPLISAVDSNKVKDYDIWGAPCTSYTTTVTFNWIQGGVVKTIPHDDPDEALLEVWWPVSQAEVYAAAGLSVNNTDLELYTNGYQGSDVTPDRTETSTTEDFYGGQGRWTRVYDDRIVYVDTFLSVVDNIVDEVKVNGKVAIDASYDTTTYYNNYAIPTTKPVADAGYKETLTVDEASSFADGTVIASYAIAAAAPFTQDGDGTGEQIIELVNPYAAITRKNVTVQAIIYSDGPVATRTINGVQDTNGNRYLYNCTYTYNDINNDATRLGELDINSVVTLYLDENDNILGVKPATASTDEGVGVVTDYDAGRIKAGEYYAQLTVLLEDNTTATIKFLNDHDTDPTSAQQAYATEDAAVTAAEGFLGQLISWTSDTASAPTYTGYVIIVQANNGTPEAVNGPIDIGYAEALENTSSYSSLLLNDDTVFFVANYQMQNSKGGYVFTGYTAYTGFQNLPRDLSFSGSLAANTNPIAATNGVTDLYVEAFDSTLAASVTGDWADYVLIINAVNRTTNVVNPVPNYAFLADPSAFVSVYDNYYQYSAIIDGKANQPFRVDYNATGNVTGTGLYTYSEYTNDGWARVRYLNGTNYVADGKWGYTAGVLYYGGTFDYTTPGTTNVVSNADTFYTVAQSGCNVYIVDVTDGSFVSLNGVSLDNVQKAYSTNDIWFELNQYGWINTIYVVATPDVPGQGQAVTQLDDLTITSTTDITSSNPSVGDYVADYKFTANTTTSPFNGTFTVKATWLKLNGSGQYVPYTAEAFEPGTYRVQLTVTLKNGTGERYTIGNVAVTGSQVNLPATAKGATVISDIITVPAS